MAELTNVLVQIAEILKNVQDTQNQIIESKQTNYMGRDNLQPYDENNENFNSYLQRLDNHLQLRGVNKNTQTKLCVQILIGCLSPKIYQILTKLTAPDLPNTRSYDELIKLLREYLAPQASVTAEQYTFYTRLQGEGESIQCYVAELRKLTTNCDLNCVKCKTSTIETHLRAQFIRGVRDTEVRERLLQQKNPTFDDPGQINAIQKKSNHFNGNRKNYTKNTENLVGKCFRCGKTGHKANSCQAKNLKCYKCKKDSQLDREATAIVWGMRKFFHYCYGRRFTIDKPENWYKYVRKLQETLNNSYQRSINITPFELLFGTKMRRPADIRMREVIEEEYANLFIESRNELRREAKEQIKKNQEENKRTFNKRRKESQQYQVNDLVAIKRTQFQNDSKLLPKFYGPYQIVSTYGPDRYNLEKVGNHNGPNKTTSSAEKMKPWMPFEANVD